MKTDNEIRAKIGEYFGKIAVAADREQRENYCCVVDALLWVIGDESGKERRTGEAKRTTTTATRSAPRSFASASARLRRSPKTLKTLKRI